MKANKQKAIHAVQATYYLDSKADNCDNLSLYNW